MKRRLVAALVCAGAFAFASPSGAAPLSAAGSLGGGATRSAIDETIANEAATQVRYNRRAYYGWNRGRHYGWRNHGWRHRHYGWGPRYYAPRFYGYVPPRAYRRHW